MKRIALVYFVYVNAKVNWQERITRQLNSIKSSGIFKDADLHLVISNPDNTPNVDKFFKSFGIEIKSTQTHSKNEFEYRGIHKVWELANNKVDPQNSDESCYDYIIYIHTKGMSYEITHGLKKLKRQIHEVVLTQYTFKDYQKTLEILDKNQAITKAGAFPKKVTDDDTRDMVWFNFWWARASFLKTRVEPVLSDDRFYYEDWLNKGKDEHSPHDTDSYCTLTQKINQKFTAVEANHDFGVVCDKFKEGFPESYWQYQDEMAGIKPSFLTKILRKVFKIVQLALIHKTGFNADLSVF